MQLEHSLMASLMTQRFRARLRAGFQQIHDWAAGAFQPHPTSGSGLRFDRQMPHFDHAEIDPAKVRTFCGVSVSPRVRVGKCEARNG